jgi:glycine/D-amino acid oxidase-like deaminating enzyme
MRVAVLGAGLTGACVALELADAGCRVDLFERAPRALAGASENNEGKLHLGLVYANDPGGRTARTMLLGAASFLPLLSRWIDVESLAARASSPFLYAVPRDSLLPPAALRAHFESVRRQWEASRGRPGGRYPGGAAPEWSERAVRDADPLFCARYVSHVFATGEHAIDTFLLCDLLRARLAEAPRLQVRTATTVDAVRRSPRGGLRVHYHQGDDVGEEPFDGVVNATWEQRLALDRGMGLVPPRSIVHRFKSGIVTRDPALAAALPSVTFVLGPFGDTVAWADRAYASWYPAGLLRQEFGAVPDPAPIELPDARRAALVAAHLAGLRRLLPGAGALHPDTADRWEVIGGYITARGRSGIEDAHSELHERHAIGVQSQGAYHSIDTGKLTTAPLFAAEACARLLGREARRA